MLYQLYQHLQTYDLPGIGLLRYISFRAGAAFILALLLTLALGESFIRFMRRRQLGEEIRDLGLQGQREKAGTPTMGGLLILAATLLPVLLFSDLGNVYVLIMLVSTVWMGLLGATDDYIKVFRHKKSGLNGWIKIAGQVGLGLFVCSMLFASPQALVQKEVPVHIGASRLQEAPPIPDHTARLEQSLTTTIPFVKNHELDYRQFVPIQGEWGEILAWGLFVLVVVVIVTSVSNGANLTDGLDGLAAGVSVPVAAVLGVFAYLSGNVIYTSYLRIMYIPGTGELMIYMSAFVGALIGFLWFNSHPAKVFMGDTGSLTIGGVIGVFAVLVRKELLLPLLCGIFLIESLSVIMQVSFFKFTKWRHGQGKRIFLMSPLHHHYQKKGMPEGRIVVRFWIVGLLLAVLTVATLKIR